MSVHQLFKRQPVNQQVAQRLESTTFPAPTRGLVLSENESFMQPGAAVVMDNWVPTMKGAKLRGGCEEWCDLHPGSTTFSTLNPADKGAHGTLSGGNLTITGEAGWEASVRAIIANSSGKFYFECLASNVSSSLASVGVTTSAMAMNTTFSDSGIAGNCGVTRNLGTVYVDGALSYLVGGVATTVQLGTFLSGEIICVAVDLTAKLIWFRRGAVGLWNAVAGRDPATGVGGVGIPSVTTAYPALCTGSSTGAEVWTANFGATSFTGAVPAGFTSGWGTIVSSPPLTDPSRLPVISAFEYASGINHRMFAANETKLYDVTTTTPVVVASGRTSGNYVASQMANAGGDWLIAVNDAGDPPLRFNGTSWETLTTGYVPGGGLPSNITGPGGIPRALLTYVCKYRNRFFFVELNSMNAWYLPLNAAGGELNMIPLSGAATKGGKLLFCAAWSIDAGDGIDDKLVFCTDLGELLIFTGSDPASAASWRQEGRYEVSPPMGMNAHIGIGGDMLIATIDGIVPISGSITKDRSELELAAITRQIKPMWRNEVLEKREWPWTMCKWDEYGGLFVTWPGGIPGKRWCAAANLATGAWCRFVGYDATCFVKMRGDMFFGTQDGRIMQADRTGYDDGMPYTATLVGGWEVFQSPGQTITWRQARASFSARANEPFAPQLSATTDYVVTLPPPPNAGGDPGVLDLWDEGLWGTALWDASMPSTPAVRNTGWVSIGRTGFSHAPIVQVTVAQVAKPEVDLISIAATFERAGVNV